MSRADQVLITEADQKKINDQAVKDMEKAAKLIVEAQDLLENVYYKSKAAQGIRFPAIEGYKAIVSAGVNLNRFLKGAKGHDFEMGGHDKHFSTKGRRS